MTDEYRRVSVNTTLRDAKIFEDDSSIESLSDLVDKIKQEPENEKWDTSEEKVYIKKEVSSSAISTLIKQELIEDSPFKTERIEFETKLKFETDDNKDFEVSVEHSRRESAKSNILKTRNVPFNSIMSDSDWSDDDVREEDIKIESESRESAKSNTLKRRNVPFKAGSDSEDSGVSPVKKRYFETDPADNKETKKSKADAKDRRIRRRNRYVESDPEILRRRQKQVDYGKNTVGYTKYLELVPRDNRSAIDPQTPDKHRKYSRRGWDGLIKQWRLKLHNYDPEENL